MKGSAPEYRRGVRICFCLWILVALAGCEKKTDQEELRDTAQIAVTGASWLEHLSDLKTHEFQAFYNALIDAYSRGELWSHHAFDLLIVRWIEVDADALAEQLREDHDWLSGQLDSSLAIRFLKAYDEQAFWNWVEAEGLLAKDSMANKLRLFLVGQPHSDQLATSASGIHGIESVEGERLIKELSRLASTNPVEALTGLERLQWKDSNVAEASQTLLEIARTRPEAAARLAIARLQERPDWGTERGVAQSAFVEAVGLWFRGDPHEAIAAVDELDSYKTRAALLEAGFENWAEQSPDEAAKFALENVQALGIRQNLLEAVLPIWMESEPQAAAKFTLSLPPKTIHSMSEALMPWVRQSPAIALSYVHDHFQGPVARDVTTLTQQRLLADWTQREPAAAAAWVHQIEPGRLRNHYATGVFIATIRSSPDIAEGMLALMSEVLFQRKAVEQIVDDLLIQDHPKALDFVASLPTELGRRELHQKVMRDWAEKYPERGAMNLHKEDPIEEQVEHVKSFFASFYKNKPEAALRWLSEQDLQLQREASYDVVRALMRQDRQAALSYAQKAGAEIITPKAINTLVRPLAREDPDGTLQWVRTLPGELQKNAMVMVMYGYLASEPDKAIDLGKSGGQGSIEHDALAYAQALRLDKADPVESLFWATQISDSENRRIALSSVFFSVVGEIKRDTLKKIQDDPRFTAQQLKYLEDYQ